MNNFENVAYDDTSRKISEDCKAAFENVIDVVGRNLKEPSRELSLAITKLEESYMWIGKEIKRLQSAKQYHQ